VASDAYLILEDGTVFTGKSFGTPGEVTGEIVFTTGMTGYIETLTDPSYYGQIVLQTFPLIGNYGIISEDFESPGVSARAYIVKHPSADPSNFRSEGDLDSFLREQGIIGIYDIDTRALTRIIRTKGVMNGKITLSVPTEADRLEAESHVILGAVQAVSSKQAVKFDAALIPAGLPGSELRVSAPGAAYRVALMDFGAKRGIATELALRGCEVTVFPESATAEEIMAIDPHGVMLSNGPGDPADPANAHIVATIKTLLDNQIPIFGICLGHQLLGLAHGLLTRKLKFGHRGANQPVKETKTGRVFITSQNHGYAVVTDEGSFVNVNDGTCEGLDFGQSFSVQFHPEARGGPRDTGFLFDRFIERMNQRWGNVEPSAAAAEAAALPSAAAAEEAALPSAEPASATPATEG